MCLNYEQIVNKRKKNRWNEKNYDRIVVLVKKGRRDAIKEHATGLGESVNAYINRLIEQDMRDPGEG